MIFRSLGLFFVSLMMTAPGFSQDAPKAADAAAQAIKLPFTPPVGRDFLYEMTVTRHATGKPDQITSMRQSLRFEALGNGYVLHVKYLSFAGGGLTVDLADPAQTAKVPPTLLAFMMPVAVEMDESGDFVRVRDWADYKTKLAKFPDLMIAGEKPADRATARRAAEQALAPMMALTAESATDIILKGWPGFFGYGGAELEIGRTYEADQTLPAPVLSAELPATSRVTLSRVAGKELLLQQVTEPKEGAVGAVLAKFFGTVAASLSAERRKAIDAELEEVKGMKMITRAETRLDGETGLILEASQERLVSGMKEGGGEGIAVKLIR